MEEILEGQIAALSALVQVQKKIRACESPAELSFAIVNDTRILAEYRQAALWSDDAGVITVPGLPDIDRNSPYIHWIGRFFKKIGDFSGIRMVTSADLPEPISTAWVDWLPQFALIIPLKTSLRSASCPVVLLLARENAFQEHEIALLEEAAGIYGYAWSYFLSRKNWLHKIWPSLRKKPLQFVLTTGIIAALFIPLRLSVIAPAEIAPRDPVLIRSPLNGVIDSFHVRPNSMVKKGQPLFDLDATTLSNKLDIAKKAMQVAAAEYRRTQQKAVFDQNSKMDLAVRKGRLDEKATEVKYYSSQLDRIRVSATEAGVTVLADVHDWLGRSVAVGEKVLSIADPEKVEVVIHLPIAAAIPLRENAPMKLFLNVAPSRPFHGEIISVSYRAEPTVEGILSYRVKGRLADGEEIPRIGLSGTAKIYGSKTTLFYYLFRRPLAALRQGLGI